MDLAPLAAVGTLVFALVNFMKYLAVRNWNGAITQLIAWTAGVVGILLIAHTVFAAAIIVGNVPLQSMNFWSQLFVGLMATSLLTTLNEGYKAIDVTTGESANKLKLFPRLSRRTPAAVGATSSVNNALIGHTTPPSTIPPHRTPPQPPA